MKNILIINFSNLKTDARVRRHVNLLKQKYALTVACFDADLKDDYKVIILNQPKLTLVKKAIISFFLLFRLFRVAHNLLHPYRDLLNKTKTEKFDLIIANDVESLPIAFEISEQQDCGVLFDAHEYAPRHFEEKWVWRLFFQPLNIHLCKKYIPRASVMITVGNGLANEYEKHFRVKPVVISNANHYHDLVPSPINGSAIKLVHHGIATPSRKLELMIDMMDHLDDRFTLDMYLLSITKGAKKTANYPQELKEKASKNPRIKILPPIKGDEIVSTINSYDIGVIIIPPINFNYANGLPNKLFDCIQARLALAVGPTPEMAEIVKHYGLGVVSDNFSAENLAQKIQSISFDDLKTYKQKSSVAASELNAEVNGKILLSVIEKALTNN